MLMRLDSKVELTARARVTLVASQDVQYNTGSKLDLCSGGGAGGEWVFKETDYK